MRDLSSFVNRWVKDWSSCGPCRRAACIVPIWVGPSSLFEPSRVYLSIRLLPDASYFPLYHGHLRLIPWPWCDGLLCDLQYVGTLQSWVLCMSKSLFTLYSNFTEYISVSYFACIVVVVRRLCSSSLQAMSTTKEVFNCNANRLFCYPYSSHADTIWWITRFSLHVPCRLECTSIIFNLSCLNSICAQGF